MVGGRKIANRELGKPITIIEFDSMINWFQFSWIIMLTVGFWGWVRVNCNSGRLKCILNTMKRKIIYVY